MNNHVGQRQLYGELDRISSRLTRLEIVVYVALGTSLLNIAASLM